MKIIHCADIHLDSPMNRLGTPEKRKERKAELIKAYTDMISFASREGVRAVIIAGDLFDQSRITATARNAVVASVIDHPDIEFFYLKGNHDKTDFLNDAEGLPRNLHMFSEEWTYYDIGENICISGVELSEENAGSIYARLDTDVTQFNIVTLHGQEAASSKRDNAQVISLRDLRNRNIDYLALGHVHSFRYEKLDSRGHYCYPGCLEARGYDETGEHGFMLLDVDGVKRTYTSELIIDPIRDVHLLKADISDCLDSAQIINQIDNVLRYERIPSKDLVKVELTGTADFECEKNPEFIGKYFADRYFDFKLKDCTVYKVDYEKFRLDESLKGEFIRTVEAEPGISEDEKAEIIRTGIKALMSGEIDE